MSARDAGHAVLSRTKNNPVVDLSIFKKNNPVVEKSAKKAKKYVLVNLDWKSKKGLHWSSQIPELSKEQSVEVLKVLVNDKAFLKQYELAKDSHRNTLPNVLLAVTLVIAASHGIQSKLMDIKRRAEVAKFYRTDVVPKLVEIARKHGGRGAGAITERNRIVQYRKAISLNELVAAIEAAANAKGVSSEDVQKVILTQQHNGKHRGTWDAVFKQLAGAGTIQPGEQLEWKRAQEIRNLLDCATVVREDRKQWTTDEIKRCVKAKLKYYWTAASPQDLSRVLDYTSGVNGSKPSVGQTVTLSIATLARATISNEVARQVQVASEVQRTALAVQSIFDKPSGKVKEVIVAVLSTLDQLDDWISSFGNAPQGVTRRATGLRFAYELKPKVNHFTYVTATPEAKRRRVD